MKKSKYDRLHPKQILTTKKMIRRELSFEGGEAIEALLRCLSCETGSPEQKNYMVVAAMYFERISRAVYEDKDGSFRKLDIRRYYEEIFTGYAEDPEEVLWRTERYGVTPESAEHIFKLVWQVADLICPMMACVSEHAFVFEYAFAIEYVIKHNGDLPKPEIKLLFPSNYPEYNYTEGIAEEIQKYCLL